MKKTTIIVLLGTCLAACSVRKPVLLAGSAVDYSKYTANNFFITEANSVAFDYKPISSVYSIFKSGYETKPVTKMVGAKDDIYGIPQTTTSGKYIAATQDGALELLYKKAVELGANGIINLKFDALTSYNKDGSMVHEGFQATGMAIKR